jgi:hypothetical protein
MELMFTRAVINSRETCNTLAYCFLVNRIQSVAQGSLQVTEHPLKSSYSQHSQSKYIFCIETSLAICDFLAICDLQSHDLICDLRFGLRSAIPESHDSSAICDSSDFFAIWNWDCDVMPSAIRNRCDLVILSKNH